MAAENVKSEEDKGIITQNNSRPQPAELASLSTRARLLLQLWVVKIIVRTLLFFIETFYNPKSSRPTLTKRYPCRPNLEVRIFLPEPKKDLTSKSDAISQQLVPLYINIHGGGFAIGKARFDDNFCRKWTKRTGMIVASLNYSKAPIHPFPTPVHDIANLANAIINDDSLPIDKTRVITGGFSAGGNLALTATLTEPLKGKVKATVSYFPVVDWSSNPQAKYEGRLCQDRPDDGLISIAPAFDWGYVSAGQDRKDKLLSPVFATPDELPSYICMVGAQHDMLCREARDMIYNLASLEQRQTNEGAIPDISVDDNNNNQKIWNERFERGRYKWMLMAGMKHGFTDDFLPFKDARTLKRKQICEDMYADIHRWMVEKIL